MHELEKSIGHYLSCVHTRRLLEQFVMSSKSVIVKQSEHVKWHGKFRQKDGETCFKADNSYSRRSSGGRDICASIYLNVEPFNLQDISISDDNVRLIAARDS